MDDFSRELIHSLDESNDKLIYSFQFYYGYLRKVLDDEPEEFDY